MDEKIYTYSDGGSRGNPGPAAIGVILADKNKNIIQQYKEYIGKSTNNQAEYKAITKALELALNHKARELICTLDSELVVKQLNGQYKIKDKKLQLLFAKLKRAESKFKKITYQHAKRTNPFIQKADSLVNKALDEKN